MKERLRKKRLWHRDYARRKRLDPAFVERARRLTRESFKRNYIPHPIKKLSALEKKQRRREYYLRNRQKRIEQTKAWRSANPEKTRLTNQRHALRYLAKKRERVHPKMDYEAEEMLFAECQQKIRDTGEPHQVDHIIPLKMGGWHHHQNLQVLPAIINKQKAADPFWQMSGYKSWRDVPQELWPPELAASYLDLKRAS